MSNNDKSTANNPRPVPPTPDTNPRDVRGDGSDKVIIKR